MQLAHEFFLFRITICIKQWSTSHSFVSNFVQTREKRRWLFRKPSNNNATQNEAKLTKSCAPSNKTPEVLPPDHRHAIAVAAATAAAAEAAVATAQAAVEIIRLTRSSNPNPSSFRQNYASIIIQKAFRGYLVSN